MYCDARTEGRLSFKYVYFFVVKRNVTLTVIYFSILLSSLRPAVSLTLSLGTTPLTNNSVVVITDIEDGRSGGSPLICATTFTPCCKVAKQGEWYYPDGTMVPGSSADEDFYRSRSNNGEVRLNRRNNAMTPTGIFRCELPVSDNVIQTLYVGVYASNDNGEMFSS